MRIKFETAEDVYLAFPTLTDDTMAKPDESDPITFVKALALSETPEDSLSFFAYLAPRREAVWWASRCLHSFQTPDPRGSLAAADAWLRDPEEPRRVAALDLAQSASHPDETDYVAYAAGWSGGNIAADGQPAAVSAPPYLTAKAARAAVLIAIARGPMEERRVRLERCLDEALRVANDDIEAHF
ncbi:MAG: hypothetical protein AAGF49_14325 [Pseudomonadota bacterium]